MIDKVFDKPIEKQFEFDEEVAAVFDDMLARSVPFYNDVLDLSARFAQEYLSEGSRVYDLGCSTASQLLKIEEASAHSLDLIGLDTSDAMLSHAKKKIEAFKSGITLYNADILEHNYQEARVFLSNYTLQFIRPLVREELIEKIYSALESGGVFIFSEKVISEDKKLNKALIDCYYDFKEEQGYSKYEIAQKREALENVLVPYSVDENIKMIKKAGFSSCEIIFKWANFATFIATKP